MESCYSGELLTGFDEAYKEDSCDICFITSTRAHEEALAQGLLLINASLEILNYTHQPKGTFWVNSDSLIENLKQQLMTSEGWQRFGMKLKGHLMLTNCALSQQVDLCLFHIFPSLFWRIFTNQFNRL